MIDWITSFFGFRIANKNLLVIFILGILLRLLYLDYTPYDVRAHDVQGHLDYMRLITSDNPVPKPDQCWECYQKPLYYVLSSRLHDLLYPVGDEKFYRILQILSLVFYSGFLFFGMMAIREIFENERYANLASSLLVFWPSGIIQSVMIGNDDIMYFFYSVGLYLLVKWVRSGRYVFLAAFVPVATLGYLSKSSGSILVFVAVAFVAAVIFSKVKSSRASYLISLCIILIALSVILLFVRPISGRSGLESSKFVIGNVSGLNGELLVGNNIGNYLHFDIAGFFRNPFADAWHDSGGRQFFINYLLKTSMFGEYSFEYPASGQMAIVLGAILIMICLMALVGIVVAANSENLVFVAMLLNLGFFLTALVSLRVALPFSCSGDFRYAAPIVISLAAFFVFSLKYFSKRKLFFVEKAGFAAGYAFVACSIAFYLDPFIMNLLR